MSSQKAVQFLFFKKIPCCFPHGCTQTLCLLKNIYLLIMLLKLSHFPPSLHSILPILSLPHSPLEFMSMDPTYKFFGFYISYAILTLPLSIFYLPFMLLILCTFPPLSLSHSAVGNPPCELHFCGSVPVLVVCIVCSCVCFRCGC